MGCIIILVWNKLTPIWVDTCVCKLLFGLTHNVANYFLEKEGGGG